MEIPGISTKRSTILGVCFVTVPVSLIMFTIIYQINSSFDVFGGFNKGKLVWENAQNLTAKGQKGTQNISASSCIDPREDDSLPADTKLSFPHPCLESNSFLPLPPAINPSQPPTSKTSTSIPKPTISNPVDKLLDGLLAPDFDEGSCLGRYQAYLLRKASPHKPSPYLLSKLRNYEDLHRHCGPHTRSYYRATRTIMKSNHNTSGKSVCNYIVWRPVNGLGNRMISMAATFLYAMLTDRVILVEFNHDMMGLFCEPFPNLSWILPHDFPYRDKLDSFQDEHIISIKHNESLDQFVVPSILFVNLERDTDGYPTFFHCDHIQSLLQKVPVLLLRSDQYFVPSLFTTPIFKTQLEKMFPEKGAVFHHLGRYLFHPSNEVWGLISRFHQAYLARADEKIGLQIRVFNTQTTPWKTVMDQILACTLRNEVLPEVDMNKSVSGSIHNRTSKAVLVASLYPEYAKNLRIMYWSRPTVTGEVIGVYQPSNEGEQKWGDNNHNIRAWTEIYLLGLCDVLVTSGTSTFGYVAYSLGGLRPWIMQRTGGTKLREPPCQRTFSMEPCFHFPPKYECKAPNAKVGHISNLFPNMMPCEDRRGGVKLIG